jgi:hypothetical protein
LLIAIEPAICFLVFAALTLGLIFHPPTPANLEGAKGHEHDGCFNGYVAVLSEERRTVAEWPIARDVPVVDSIRPALIEFSRYGGIHRIDGRSTGVIPESMPALGGIGANLPRI